MDRQISPNWYFSLSGLNAIKFKAKANLCEPRASHAKHCFPFHVCLYFFYLSTIVPIITRKIHAIIVPEKVYCAHNDLFILLSLYDDHFGLVLWFPFSSSFAPIFNITFTACMFPGHHKFRSSYSTRAKKKGRRRNLSYLWTVPYEIYNKVA